MTTRKANSREKILAAAAEVARDIGAGHLSLDAVARRAGVSKGGLLYNFPTKASLMQGLVEDYVGEFERSLDASVSEEKAGSTLLEAYVDLSAKECVEAGAQGAGVFAALAENPDFLQPVRAFKRRLLDRLKADTDDLAGTLLSYLALEGLRSTAVFDLDVLTDEERDLVLTALTRHARADA